MSKFWLLIPILLITGCSPEMLADNLTAREVRTAGAEWELVKNSVHDGDTFRVIHNSQIGDEIKIRLACIDAPEKKQDLGIASRDYLRSLLNRNPKKIILSISNNWTVRSSRKINEFTRVSAPNALLPSSRLTIAETLSMQGF